MWPLPQKLYDYQRSCVLFLGNTRYENSVLDYSGLECSPYRSRIRPLIDCRSDTKVKRLAFSYEPILYVVEWMLSKCLLTAAEVWSLYLQACTWLYLLALNKFVLAGGNECDAIYTFYTADKWKHHLQKVESGGLLFSLLMLHIRNKSPLVHMV
jgi:hypothetical protein